MFTSALLFGYAAVATAMQCRNLTVPVSLSARNGVFDLKAPATEIEVTDLSLGMSRPGNNATAQYLKGVSTGLPPFFFSPGSRD